MLNPIELDEGNILKYPKSLFSRKEVLEEKHHMGTPNAWVFREGQEDYFLEFSEPVYDKSQKGRKHKALSTVTTGRF